MQACSRADCLLCRHNPHKRCDDEALFEASAAQGQALRARCGGEIDVELVRADSGDRVRGIHDVGVQVCVVDGRSCRQSLPSGGSEGARACRQLLHSDDGNWLLEECMEGGAARCTRAAAGHLSFQLQDGYARLPPLQVTEKTDSFRMGGQVFSNFRLVARAVRFEPILGAGNCAKVLEDIGPAVSNKFLVKSLKAVDSLNQPSYLHYKDSLQRLKYMSAHAADCLWNIQAHIPDCPFTSIQSVEHLIQLIWYTDHQLDMKAKLLEVLNMTGSQQHKWAHICSFLSGSVVYDDDLHRAWFSDEAMTLGLLFACQQGQIDTDTPLGIVERNLTHGQLQVFSLADTAGMEAAGTWMLQQAKDAWESPGHQGWVVVNEPLDLAGPSSTPPPLEQLRAASSTALSQESRELQDFPSHRSHSFPAQQSEWRCGGERSSWAAPPPPTSMLTGGGHWASGGGAQGTSTADAEPGPSAVPGAMLPSTSAPQAKRQRVSAEGGQQVTPVSSPLSAFVSPSTPRSTHMTDGSLLHQLSARCSLPPKPATYAPSPRAVSCTGQGPRPERQLFPDALPDPDFSDLLTIRSSAVPQWAERLSAPTAPSPSPSPAAQWQPDPDELLRDLDPFSAHSLQLRHAFPPVPAAGRQLVGARACTLSDFSMDALQLQEAPSGCGRSMSTGHVNAGGGIRSELHARNALRSALGGASAPAMLVPASAPCAGAPLPQQLWPQDIIDLDLDLDMDML